MGKNACDNCGCCNHCNSRHEDSEFEIDFCPMDPDVPQEKIEEYLRSQGIDPEKSWEECSAMLKVAKKNAELTERVTELENQLKLRAADHADECKSDGLEWWCVPDCPSRKLVELQTKFTDLENDHGTKVEALRAAGFAIAEGWQPFDVEKAHGIIEAALTGAPEQHPEKTRADSLEIELEMARRTIKSFEDSVEKDGQILEKQYQRALQIEAALSELVTLVEDQEPFAAEGHRAYLEWKEEVANPAIRGELNLEPQYEDDRHCDNYINDPDAPMALRWFLFINRLPAIDKMLCRANGVKPALFARHEGEWCRVVMASRMGDVGITGDLDADRGYQVRLFVGKLEDFTDQDPRTEAP